MHMARYATVVLGVAGAVPAQGLVPGSFTTFGQGCVAGDDAIYELFEVGGFDLANSAHQYVMNGQGSYTVLASTATRLPFGSASPTAINIGAADDFVSGPHTLTFPFHYPAGLGTTTQVWVYPNGGIYFEHDVSTRCCDGEAALDDALSAAGVPGIAAYSNDLDVTTSSPWGRGKIWVDEQLRGGQRVWLATWDNAGEYGVAAPVAAHNFQIQLWDDDRVVVVHASHTATVHRTLVGWSAGGGQPRLAMDNFSNLPIDGGDGVVRLPLTLAGSTAAPVEGQSFDFVLGDVPLSGSSAAVMLGAVPMSVSLDVIGMATCTLHTAGDIFAVPVVRSGAAGGIATLGTLAGAVGIPIQAQAVVLAPGTTALGVVLSNAAELIVGSDASAVDCTIASGLVVCIEGTNTFSATARATKFWNVYNNSTSGERIRSVTFDLFGGGPLVAGGRAVFDPDGLPATTGEFDAGISRLLDPSCPANTYGGSDVAAGLDYAGTDPAACGPTMLAPTTGWRGSNFDSARNPATVEFRFAGNLFGPGVHFAFEADVDGGPLGASGLHQCRVTITTDQRSVSEEMVVVDADTAVQVW